MHFGNPLLIEDNLFLLYTRCLPLIPISDWIRQGPNFKDANQGKCLKVVMSKLSSTFGITWRVLKQTVGPYAETFRLKKTLITLWYLRERFIKKVIINMFAAYFVNKGLSSQGYGFSSGHIWMWELDYKESLLLLLLSHFSRVWLCVTP